MNQDKDEIGLDIENFDLQAELKRFDDFKCHPTKIMIRLYIPPQTRSSGLIVPNEMNVYSEITGYVAKIGSHCFTGPLYEKWGKWYKIGDWLAFPRHAGIRFTYNNLPVFVIDDDTPLGVISDPTKAR